MIALVASAFCLSLGLAVYEIRHAILENRKWYARLDHLIA